MPQNANATPAFRKLNIWPLHTERLTLRPAELGDSEALWRHRSLPEVGMWLGWHPVDRKDWNETYAAKHADYLVVERDGEIIGDLMLRSGDGWGQREVKDQAVAVQAELGWTFAPEVGGKGYATEAVAALVERAKRSFTDLAKTGEGGEMLLFLLAERFLKLPQIL